MLYTTEITINLEVTFDYAEDEHGRPDPTTLFVAEIAGLTNPLKLKADFEQKLCDIVEDEIANLERE